MALSISLNQTPVISTGMNTIVASTTTSGVFKFRYHLRVEYWVSGELLTKAFALTQPKNSSGYGVFNMSEIYKNIVTPMITSSALKDQKSTTDPSEVFPIHNIPFLHTDSGTTYQYLYSRPYMESAEGWDAFQGHCNKALLTFNEMYSTTANGIPTIQGTAVTKSQYVYWGRGERGEGTYNLLSDYFLIDNTKYLLTNNYKWDSTIARFIGNVGREQHMTMAFVNGHLQVAGNTGADTYGMQFKYYDSSGTQIGALFCRNEAISGGKYGGTDGFSNTGRSFFLTIGSGLKNLDEIDTSLSSYTGLTPDNAETASGSSIAYYEMYMMDSTSAIISSVYRFNVTTPCDRYDETRLAYMNRWGCWEYINLNKKRKETYSVKRDTINKPIIHGNVPDGTTDGTIVYNTYPDNVAHQGAMVTSVSVEDDLSLFTQNLDDSELDRINDLILSPQIHMNEKNNDNWVALVCKTSKIKTKVKGDNNLYSYELKFKFAEPKYRTT